MNNRIGHCYELNFLYQIAHPDYTLVHGYITNNFPPYQTIDHAWCIKDNLVYDAVLDEEYIWEVYQSIFNAQIEIQYTINEAFKKALKYETYGCWHKPRNLHLDKYYDNNRHLKDKYH